jgi:hypothetical protein
MGFHLQQASESEEFYVMLKRSSCGITEIAEASAEHYASATA